MTDPDDGAGLPITERMQELLARAAEDQLSEQRQLAEALTELRAQMEHITADVAAMRADTVHGERVDTAVGSVSAEVREAVRLIGERLDGLARMVHQRGLDLAELRGSFAELKAHVTSHGEALNGLTGGLDSIPSYGEQVAALHQTVAALSERLGGMDDVRAAVAEVDHRVGSTADALTDVRYSLEALRQQSGGAAGAGDLEATAGQVAALSQRIDDLSAVTAPLAERLTSMQESLRLEAERNARLAEQLTTLGMRLDAVGDNATTARSDSESLSRRLDLLQEDVTAIGSNVAGLVESGPDPAELAAALDAARSAGDQIGRVNEMAVQVAEVRAALLGDDGLEAQVASLSRRISGAVGEVVTVSDEVVQAAVTEAVKQEVAASEARLGQRLDEAVLALAEVLLRRRSSRVGAALSRSAVGDFWAPTAAESGALAGPGLPDVPYADPETAYPETGLEAAFAEVGPEAGYPEPADLDAGGAAAAGTGFEGSFDDVPATFTKGDGDVMQPPAGTDEAALLDEGEGTDLQGAVEGAEAAGPDATGWLDDEELGDDEFDDQDFEVPAGELGGSASGVVASWDVGPVSAASGDEPLIDFAGGDQPGSAEADEIGRSDLARAAAEASAALSHTDEDSAQPEAPPADDGEWAATVQSEVTVEAPRRKRRPWWRPGD